MYTLVDKLKKNISNDIYDKNGIYLSYFGKLEK